MISQLKQITSKTSDLAVMGREIMASGLHSVHTQWKSIDLFGALYAAEDSEGETDATHYFLIPIPDPLRGFTIYSKRVLPPGVGAENCLPKERIFHLPDPSTLAHLETALITSQTTTSLQNASDESLLAKHLDEIADRIDTETYKVSGGILLIGGAVALINPVVGIGIAAKALLPSLGNSAIQLGSKFLGDKLRNQKQSVLESKARKEAEKDLKRLKPQTLTNPLLRSLHAILTNPESNYDPSMDQRNWADSFPSQSQYQMTCEAIHEVYQSQQTFLKPLPASHKHWIDSLKA
ncbi:hypothetical protein [Rubritalea tangerina]|uniref:Uncharacterized protein n=1 Tax=Rubritalea tangerina TaxID=430798 RepID=A0ABW4ZFG5_9BACT